ncbi:MAG: SAV_2336 N-terminal domain-related protein [Polaromonas sp.]|uniref:SAV_2336 N-terminal domain-related protein n=1 Tax=Polaromonas sp. TaxID=1869339 RepID=UPI002736F390|nr:SAV_2336 N-terminal domain-related protein [Polaromonas sp.]MDP3799608.1 SAV_2336 N-terminal domain-related protein [Polaromonas sp.]
MLSELSRRLRAAGLGVSIEEMEDILWLAGRLPAVAPSAAANEPADALTRTAATDADTPPLAPPAGTDDDTRRSRHRAGKRDGGAGIFSTTVSGTVRASTLRVPGVASTEHPEQLRRALQPFARRVPSRWHSVLDEDETASRAADAGVWCPVYWPVRERWFDLSVVIESSLSMALWDDTLAEFMRLLRNQGGFRSVAVYRLGEDDTLIADGPSGSRSITVSSLRGRDHPRLVLLVTDATSLRWRSGAVKSFLCEVGSSACVSVLQVMPRRVWRHTAIGEPEISLFAEHAGEANVRMTALLPWWLDESDARDCLRLPVIGLDTATIGQWARTMTARGGATVSGVLMTKAHVARPAATESAAATPAARVARYRAMVSREAYDLAVFLSVPDPLTIPVMRLVQRTMLPNSSTADLAEFFVGGLIRRMEATPPGEGTLGETSYRFIDGVRDELTRSLRYSEEGQINAQLRSVGQYLLEQGSEDSSFQAYFPSPTGRHRLTTWSMPFANVSREVLKRRSGGEDAAISERSQDETSPDAAATVSDELADVILRIAYDTRDQRLRFTLHLNEPSRFDVDLPMSMERIVAIGNQATRDADQLQGISDRLVPVALHEALDKVQGCVGLMLDAGLQSVPWELLLWTRRGRRTNLLALSVPVVRREQARPRPRQATTSHPVVWIVGDPAGLQPELPQAQQEAKEVARAMALLSSTYDIRTEIRGSSGNVLKGLSDRPFRVLFISGHGVKSIGPSGDARAGVQHGQSDLLTVDDILSHESPPELVFLACNYLAEMASALLRAGVSVVVAANDVVDEYSSFPVKFFECMVEGLDFAQSTLKARQACFEERKRDSDISWSQYLCFGDPNYQLVREDDAKPVPAGQAESEPEPAAQEAAVVLTEGTSLSAERFERGGLEVSSWPQQSPLYRVLREGFLPPNFPNSESRFHTLGFELKPGNRNVPVLYVATSVWAALSESVLSLAGSSFPRVVNEAALHERVCATLSPTRALSLVLLSREQLVRLGIDSNDFESKHDLRTELVNAIRKTRPDIDGVGLMSRVNGAAEIICLFGDRVQESELVVENVEPILSKREELADALKRLAIGLIGTDRRKRIFISYVHDYASYATALEQALDRDLEVDGLTGVRVGEGWMSALNASIERADAIVVIVGSRTSRQSEAEIRLAMKLGKRVISVVADDFKVLKELREVACANVDASGRVALLSGLQGAALARVIDSTAVNVLRALGVDTAPLLLDLKHTYEDRASRFFRPPGEVEKLGRRLHEGDFRALVSQLGPDELLMGLYENQAPALVATHVLSKARFQELSQAKSLTPLGFFALRRDIANRGWDAGTPVPAREPGSDEAPSTRATLRAGKPVAADISGPSSRPASGGTNLEFEESAALTPELRALLSSAFLSFEAFLVGCGYRPRESSLKVFVDPDLKDNVYYEPSRVVLGAPLATDTDAFFRECSHHALLSIPFGTLGKHQRAIESGLADYFACSFNNDPRFGEQSIQVFSGVPEIASKGALRLLENDRHYDEARSDSEMHDVGEIWGGAFWEMRHRLGSQLADRLLFEGWHASIMPQKRTKDFKRTFITTLMEAARLPQLSRATDVAELFSRRGFGRFKP